MALETFWGPHTHTLHMVLFEFTMSHGLYPSHNALQVPILLGVVASVCTQLPTLMQQLPTLLAHLIHDKQSCQEADLCIKIVASYRWQYSLFSDP